MSLGGAWAAGVGVEAEGVGAREDLGLLRCEDTYSARLWTPIFDGVIVKRLVWEVVKVRAVVGLMRLG